MINKAQVKQLLGSGLSNEIVASTVGCDVSYITQLMGDDTFREEVIGLRTAALTAHNVRDDRIDKLEDALIDKMEEIVPTLYKPQDITRAFVMVNAAKRRGIPAHQSTQINNQIVNLMLPTKIINNFILNSQGEVLEVGGQTLVTKQAHTLMRDLIDKGKGDGKYQEAAKLLPGHVLAAE